MDSGWSLYGRKLAIFAVGVAGSQGINFLFDYGVYPATIWWLGMLWGGIVMTLVTIVANVGLIRLYDYLGQDWLLIETAKSLRDGEIVIDSKIGHWVNAILRRSDVVALLVLSTWQDPVVATLYLRHGANQYNGLSRRDWHHFIISTVITNIWWTLVMGGGIAAVNQALVLWS